MGRSQGLVSSASSGLLGTVAMAAFVLATLYLFRPVSRLRRYEVVDNGMSLLTKSYDLRVLAVECGRVRLKMRQVLQFH